MKGTVAALLALVTAACGTDPPPIDRVPPAATAGVPAVPGIEAEVVRLRTDEAVGGRVQVRVTDSGDAPFTVTAVTLESDGFETLPLTPVRAQFAPGRVIDLPVGYGAPVCDSAPVPAVARLALLRPDGSVEEVRVPADADILARVHTEDCAALGIAEVVDMTVQGLEDDADGVSGELVFTRRSGTDAVTADRLDRSVLVDVVAALPFELAEGEQAASTLIAFSPASCDPHVLAETKQPFRFLTSVTVGDGEAVVLDLPLDQPTRDRLAAMVQRVCSRS